MIRRALPVLVVFLPALALLAVGCAFGLGVGDPDASGIVEESLGGAGSAAVVMAILVGVPSLVAGAVIGVVGGSTSRGVRAGVRWTSGIALGVWTGLLVYVVGALSCDGSCIHADRGAVLAAAGVGLAALVAAAGLAAVVDGWVGRRRAAAVAPGAATDG